MLTSSTESTNHTEGADVSHITAPARKGSLTVKAVVSGDSLLAIHDSMHSKILLQFGQSQHGAESGSKRKIQSLCKEPDLVICDHECLYVAFLEHLINFMGSFSSKCL